VYQLSVFGSVRRVVRSLRVTPVAIALAGIVALTLATTLFTATPAADAAPSAGLHFQRGYYLDNGWFCYGWSSGYYRCTHHWHRSGGRIISDNPAWVPNFGVASAAAKVSHSTSSKRSTSTSTRKTTTSTRKTTAPAHAPVTSGGSVVGMIESIFGPYAGQALSVARCESGYNPGAYNSISVGGSHAEGVFQILYPSTWSGTSYAGSSPYNAWANIHAAYQIFARDGYSWREWVCR
jgi:hypothetical protein